MIGWQVLAKTLLNKIITEADKGTNFIQKYVTLIKDK